MSWMLQILVRAGGMLALAMLMACGQQGPLFLPQTGGSPAASLPQTLWPTPTAPAASAAPAAKAVPASPIQ